MSLLVRRFYNSSPPSSNNRETCNRLYLSLHTHRATRIPSLRIPHLFLLSLMVKTEEDGLSDVGDVRSGGTERHIEGVEARGKIFGHLVT